MFKPSKYFKDKYGISNTSLIGWSSGGNIGILRHHGGKRMYNVNDVERLIGSTTPSVRKRKLIYLELAQLSNVMIYDARLTNSKKRTLISIEFTPIQMLRRH